MTADREPGHDPITGLPAYLFADGPAAGRLPVWPGEHGDIPRFVTVPDERSQHPWVPKGPTDPCGIQHLYKAIKVADARDYVFRYVHTSPAGLHITCRDCGQRSSKPGDISDGYCAICHRQTAQRYPIALRLDDDIVVVDGVQALYAVQPWVPDEIELTYPGSPAGFYATPTRQWIRSAINPAAYAMVCELRRR